ncbi:MAG: amidohydrolase family protein [Thermoplasmatales archaeon]|nr:amidohydrolase family protein [Thermoplasmatales archaeon]
MLIDAHIHMWHRDVIPDEAVRSYMGPTLQFLEQYGNVFDFNLDDEIPYSDYYVPIERPLSVMDANGYDLAVVLITDYSMVNEGRMSIQEYHDWVFDRCSVDDRFMPFIGVDPNRPDASELVGKLSKKHDSRGIKLYPATGFYPDDPKYLDFWKAIEDLGLLVVTHAGMALPPLDEKYCRPSNLAAVAERHPDTDIIVAHLGGKFHDELYPLMEAHENIHSDCSALQAWNPDDRSMVDKRLSEAMSRFPDRIVFGTDYPLYLDHTSPMQFIRQIREGDWGNDAVKDKLLGGNMARLLGI